MEADFASHYGIDLSEPLFRAKTYRWLKVRLHGLLTDPSTRLWRFFLAPIPDDDDQGEGVAGDGE